MKVRELVDRLGLEVITCREQLNQDVRGGYVSDMLSDVMANAPAGSVWLTMQSHPNVVAVAILRSLAAVVLVGGRKPQPETAEKAEEENLVLLGTKDQAFELAGKMYEAGIRGE